MIYLDHAATTPVAREVADTMYDVLLNGSGNPSSQYPYGAAAKKRLEADRAVIAAALGCKPDELYFTSCGTESDNWAIRLAAHQNRRVGKHIITTAVEHSAVLEPCRQLEQEGYAVTYLAPDRQGNITAQQVADALREDTALVSVMLVNNETGCVFPVAEIARLLRERGSRALLHTDAVQAFLKLPFRADTLGADLISVSGHKLNVNVQDLNVDMLSLSGHKFHAPKGVGALYIGPRCRAVRPLLAGGGQERGLRSGTEATAQIAGFAKAVELRLEGYEEKLARMAQLKQYALEQLLTIDGVVRIGNGDAPHILSVSLVGYPSANVVTELGAQGICISSGSACHRGKLSHVYAAMKLDKKTAAGVLRVSFAPETTEADVDALVSALRRHRETRFPML